ncbi:MAG TPA: biotin/lipoyl-containing protein [Candidatus Limnocylindrales bacterium]
MTRWHATDRTTGEILGEPDPPEGGPTNATPPGERPLVLPSDATPSVRGRIPLEVVVAGWRFDLEVEDATIAEIRERATAGHEAAVHRGPTEVRAIIPGRVVAVAVVAGEAVMTGQRLLAVEAMKMENELRAPRDGTIERVVVAVGETVELGDPLVVIR